MTEIHRVPPPPPGVVDFWERMKRIEQQIRDYFLVPRAFLDKPQLKTRPVTAGGIVRDKDGKTLIAVYDCPPSSGALVTRDLFIREMSTGADFYRCTHCFFRVEPNRSAWLSPDLGPLPHECGTTADFCKAILKGKAPKAKIYELSLDMQSDWARLFARSRGKGS